MSILFAVKSEQTLDPTRGAPSPTGFDDLLPAFFDNTRKNYLFNSESSVLAEAERMQAEQYRQRTGRDVNELMPVQVYQQWREENYGGRADWTPAERRAVLEEKIADSGVEVDGQQFLAQQIIAQSDHRLQDALSRRVAGTGTLAPMIIGGLSGAMTDPLNLASMLMGAGAGRTILQTMMIEAALGAGSELIQQPQIAEWQSQLGKQYGLSEMAMSVAFAGAGAGILSGVIKAPSMLWRNLREESEGLLKEAMQAREPEILLLEYKPEGMTMAEHAANQAKFLDNANRLGEARTQIGALQRGDVSLDLDKKLDPLAIAIRAASRDEPTVDLPTDKIDAAVKKALRERAKESALNLRDKELSSTKAKEARKTLEQEQRRFSKDSEWWIDQARKSLEAKAERTGRTIDLRGKKAKARLRAEAESLRVEALARKANAKKVLRRKTATKAEKAEARRTVSEVKKLEAGGKENWERLAVRGMEEVARKGGRPIDYMAELLDEFQMPTKKMIPKVVAAEADRLRAASLARQRAAEDLLNNHNVAVRARQEAAALKEGKIPERLRSTYEAGKAELEFQVRRRIEHGDEAIAKIARIQADDMARLSMYPKTPARSVDEINAEIEIKESPEYKGALDADLARMREDAGDVRIDDGDGNTISINRLLDDADEAEQNVTEALTTCGVGKLG